MHRSRIGVVVIDCQTRDLTQALKFWKAALGCEGALDADGKYATLHTAGQIGVLLQAVDHEPRVHLDIETDDRDAERDRLAALGAAAEGWIREWHVMRAPTGHRFCLVGPQGGDFPAGAAEWGAEA